MLKLILFKLWPALVPILLYFIYTLIRPKKGDAVIDAKRTQHWPYVILLSIILCAGILLYTAVSSPRSEGTHYQPTHMENGKLVKESIKP